METVVQMIETSGPGGAENMLIRLSIALQGKGYKVVVILLKNGWLKDELERHDITTEVIPTTRTVDIGWIKRAMKVVRAYGADVLHCHEFTMNCYGAAISYSSKIPCVATVHGKSYYGDRMRRKFAYRLASKSATFVAVSNDIRNFLQQEVGVKNVDVIANGIAVDDYRYDDDARSGIRKALRLTSSTVLVGAIGSLYAVKGHTYLLQAVAQLMPTNYQLRVAIVGRGKLEADLLAEIEQRQIAEHVELLGFRSDIPGMLQAIDIYVMPSLSEGLPLSLLEAMAAGKAIVAADVGGIGEVIQHEQTGLLVEPASPGQLAEAISSLIDDSELRRRLGEAAREAVSTDHGIGKMVNSYVSLYRKLLSDKVS